MGSVRGGWPVASMAGMELRAAVRHRRGREGTGDLRGLAGPKQGEDYRKRERKRKTLKNTNSSFSPLDTLDEKKKNTFT